MTSVDKNLFDYCCIKPNIDKVREILSKDPNSYRINNQKGNNNGWTPLIGAVRANRVEIAKLLINNNAALERPDKSGYTPLHYAVNNKNHKMAEFLLKNRAYPNPVDEYGDTPLHSACENGDKKSILVLLKYKARLNAINEDGKKPQDLCEDEELKTFVNNYHYQRQFRITNELTKISDLKIFVQ